LVTLETKRKWQRWAFDTNAVLIFPHDTKRPMGKLTRNAKNLPEIIPLDEKWA